MGKINVLLTFDYELPLGGVYGTFEQSLFEPTEGLLQLAKQLKVPLNFFADVLSYEKFASLNRIDFTIPFASQLETAYKQGHDVQLHLHPHWIDTNVEGNQFFPSNKYGLDSFVNEVSPNTIDEIIKRGISILNQILKKEHPHYSCIAYRGGGYVLSPCADKILTALYKNGIKIDSSISKGYFFKSDISKVDFTDIPNKSNWFLPLTGLLNEEASDCKSIFEIPIASKPKSIFEIPTAFKMKKYGHLAPKNRGYMIHQKPASLNFSEKIKKMLSYRMLTFDNYTYSKDYLFSIFDYYVSQYFKNEDIYLSVVSHPKSMGDYSFEMMEFLVEKAREKYGNDVVFTSFQDTAKKLRL